VQDELKEEFKKEKGSSKKTKVGTTGSESKSKKRKLNQADKIVDSKYKVDIAQPLKKKLLGDWEYIICKKYLITLPRTPTVSEILDSYLKETESINSNDITGKQKFNEIIESIKLYFNKALGTLLLYRFERQQYSEILKRYPDKGMVDIYGVEHLLRLFVKVPQLLANVEMEDEALNLVKSTIEDVLKYITKNLGGLSSETCYEPASPQYIRLVS